MPCYKPITGYRGRKAGPSGKTAIVFKVEDSCGIKLQLPCGRCIGCRLERARQWAVRLTHEAQLHGDSLFLTLTYNDEHLPADGNLNKKHFQDFMKRLRWQHRDKQIKFFHCGEYGERFTRPHYHACLYGINFDDRVRYSERNGIPLDYSKQLEELWGKGFASVGELTFESAAYVARYCTKKVTGLQAAEHYQRVTPYGELVEVEPEYVTMSRRPGLSKTWFDQYADEVYPSDEVISRGHPAKPPRYYDKLYEAAHGLEFANVKKNRLQSINAANNTPERLAVREKCVNAKLQNLKRSYEND